MERPLAYDQASSKASPPVRTARSVWGASTVLTDFVAIAGGRLAYALLAFGIVFVTTRILTPAAYGTVATATVVANLIFMASSGWSGAAVRRYGREEIEQRGTMGQVTWNRALISTPLMTVAIVLTVAARALGFLPPELTWTVVALIVLTALGQLVTDHWVCLLETSGRMMMSATSQVLRQAVNLVALMALYFVSFTGSAALVLGVSAAANLLLAVGLLPIVWKVGLRPFAIDRALGRRMLMFAIPVIGFIVSQYVIASVDLVVLRAFRSRSEVGIYAVAYQAYSVLASAPMATISVFLPLFVSLRMAGHGDVIVQYVRRAVPQLMLIASTVVGLAIAVLPVVVPIVLGHRFAGSAQPLAFLCVALILLFGAYLMAPILLLQEQTRAVALVSTAAAVLNVAGDLLMVGVLHIGVDGPAIATAVAFGASFALYYMLVRRQIDTGGRLDPTTLAPIGAALTANLLLPRYSAGVVGIAATLATAGLVLVWRRPFALEDVELLNRLDVPVSVKRMAQRAIEIAAAGSRR